MNTLFNGFNRSWSIKRPYMTLNDGPHYRPATNYEYGMMPPRYPMPVSRGAVRWQDMDLPALLAFGFENWLHDARPTWGEHSTY